MQAGVGKEPADITHDDIHHAQPTPETTVTAHWAPQHNPHAGPTTADDTVNKNNKIKIFNIF